MSNPSGYNYTHIVIVTTVPAMHLHALLDALAESGAGSIGNYTHCSYRLVGTGRFKPNAQADPAVGANEMINEVEEYRVETICECRRVRAVCAAIRAAHPYEEPILYLYPLLDENDFS